VSGRGPREGELETASDMATALRAGEVTASELVERALERAEAWQPAINAFSQLWPEEALDAARRVDSVDPDQRPPLAGVPVAVKDLFDVAGHETTGCSEAYRGTVAAGDAPVIERVRRAGLILIGKTNQHELAAGGTNLVSACGRTGNPWDPGRMTGGSSGGSAAAVAAGIVPWSFGSDTGGSVRIPASFCGTFGLKPTTGQLPTAGMMPLAPSMDCPGPLASTGEDLWQLYRVMAVRPAEPLGPSSKPFRVGVLDRFFAAHVHPDVTRAVEGCAEHLRGAGGDVEVVDGRGIQGARKVWNHICFSEFAAAHAGLGGRRALLGGQVRSWIEEGERLTQPELQKAAEARKQIARWFRERLEGRDALIIPTTPYPAPPAEAREVDLGPAGTVHIDTIGPGWITCTVNLAGLPAINLPAGRSGEGLPVGVSLVGHDDGEDTLLGIAARWEAVTGYRPVAPAFPTG
jgi:aspartyl-tRNA(Asn)/glutamyl-tRNA(Gln) amidotransferase subunit A